MTDNHLAVKENWSLFRSGKITLAELMERNEKIIFKNEIKNLTPEAVKDALKVFHGSEKGRPQERIR